MANENGMDGASPSLPGGGSDLPDFPRPIGSTAATPGEALPPPLKGDSGFRGAEAVKPRLRAVQSDPAPLPPAPADMDDAKGPEIESAADHGAAPVEEAPRIAGMFLPSKAPPVQRGRRIWFIVSFLLPVILGAAYLFLIAPDEYITEFRFSVRLPINHSTTDTAAGSAKSFLFDGNTTPGTDLLDNYTVADYVSTRQAALDLNQRVNLRQMFNRPFDPLSRVGAKASNERLASFWHGMVFSSYDSASGLAIVRVKAYTPQDSYAIANNLVMLASELVNKIGSSSQSDSVRYAQQEVDNATKRVQDLQKKLLDLRRDANFILPGQQGSGEISGDQSMVAQFTLRQSRLREQINQMMAQLHNPDAPQVRLLRQQYDSNERELREAQRLIGGGGPKDLAGRFAQFQFIQSQISNANAVLTSANSNLAIAQAASNAQRVNLTTYVKPTMPEAPLAPNRWLDLLIIVISAAMVWAIGRLVENSILEHG